MNKKLSFLLLALLTSFAVHAQTQKGSQLLGGSFGVDHSTSDGSTYYQGTQVSSNSKTNNISLGPSYSYFLTDNLAIGANLGYSHSHRDSFIPAENTESTSNNYFGSISLLKYFLFDSKIGIRTGPYAQYGKSKGIFTSSSLDPYYNSEIGSKNFAAGIALDFVYFPVSKIGLVASLGNLSYSQARITGNSDVQKASSLGLSFLNSPSFSVYYVFGK
jgi:outer membrane protein W